MRKRDLRKTEKIALVGVALASILAVPLVGSAAEVTDSNFGVKSENTEDSRIFAVEGLSAADDSSTATPTPDPTPEAPAKDYLTQFTINTAMANCDPSTFTLQIPAANVSATIDWGDGSGVADLKGYGNTHNYSTPGIYKLKIDGTYGGIRQGDLGNNAKKSNSCIQSLDHMGEDTGVKTLTGLFRDTTALAGVAKIPSTVTDLSSMFYRAGGITADLSKLDVSHVQNFSSMFSGLKDASAPGIGSWDTGSATDMNNMFSNAYSFDQSIGSWNVSKVTNFSSMFSNASVFNKPLAGWDVSSATNFNGMFQNTGAFNQPLAEWGSKTAKVTNMVSMFKFATSFDQDISGWNVDATYASGSYGSFAMNSALQESHKPLKFQEDL